MSVAAVDFIQSKSWSVCPTAERESRPVCCRTVQCALRWPCLDRSWDQVPTVLPFNILCLCDSVKLSWTHLYHFFWPELGKETHRVPMEGCRTPLTAKTSLGRARSCSTSARRYQRIYMEGWGLRGRCGSFLPKGMCGHTGCFWCPQTHSEILGGSKEWTGSALYGTLHYEYGTWAGGFLLRGWAFFPKIFFPL